MTVAKAVLLLACLLIGFATPAQAGPEWQLQREDTEGPTRVWLRPGTNGVPAFRATTVIAARLSSLAAVLLDSKRTQDWVFRARAADLLSSEGPTRGVTRVVTSMPFPLSDREALVAWELSQDPQTLVVTLSGHNASDADAGARQLPPPDPDRVRMPVFESKWTLTPRPDGRVDVLFEGLGDPGGNLSGPLMRRFVAAAVWEAPWSTIHALRDMVRLPEFADVQLAFIHEPQR